MGDLREPQPADRAKGERHPRIERERRVAAGEDEAQDLVVEIARFVGADGQPTHLFLQCGAPTFASDAIDRAVASRHR